MTYVLCAIGGFVIGVLLSVWGICTLPRNVARMFNTPPKGK